MPWDRQCPFPGIMSIELAVFKATTATKELRRWWLCQFPRRVCEAMKVTKDFLKCPADFSKCHGWQMMLFPGIVSIMQQIKFSGRNSFPGISMNLILQKGIFKLFFVCHCISINTVFPVVVGVCFFSETPALVAAEEL